MDLLKLDSDQICRICLAESDEMNYIFDSIAASNSENIISELLMSFAPIQIFLNDGLPSQICTNCVFEANSAFYFKEKCEKSDKLLRNTYLVKRCSQQYEAVKEEEQQILSSAAETTTDFSGLFNNNCDATVEYNFKTEILSANVIVKNQIDEMNPSNISNHETEILAVDHLGDNMSYVIDDYKIGNVIVDNNCLDQDFDDKISSYKKLRGRPKKSSANGEAAHQQKLPPLRLQCNECDENFEKKIDLRRHLAVDHIKIDNGEKKFQCIECSKQYSTDYLLIIHMKTHNGKIYECEICPKKFPRLDAFVEHKKRHTGERSYLCTKCGKGFYNQMYLQRHMTTHNKDHLEKPVYECTICGKQMNHRNHLMVHMRAHKERTEPLQAENETNKKLILCSVCGKSCSSRSNLAVHMRRHTGIMTNFCKVCGKGYPRTTDLTIHMRQHTGEKPFECQVCDRRFARSDKLAIHMRIHTGEKPYVCSVCNRAFAQSNDLASHKRRAACAQLHGDHFNRCANIASNLTSQSQTNGLISSTIETSRQIGAVQSNNRGNSASTFDAASNSQRVNINNLQIFASPSSQQIVPKFYNIA